MYNSTVLYPMQNVILLLLEHVCTCVAGQYHFRERKKQHFCGKEKSRRQRQLSMLVVIYVVVWMSHIDRLVVLFLTMMHLVLGGSWMTELPALCCCLLPSTIVLLCSTRCRMWFSRDTRSCALAWLVRVMVLDACGALYVNVRHEKPARIFDD